MYFFVFVFFLSSVHVLLSRGFSLHIQLKREGKKLLELKKNTLFSGKERRTKKKKEKTRPEEIKQEGKSPVIRKKELSLDRRAFEVEFFFIHFNLPKVGEYLYRNLVD